MTLNPGVANHLRGQCATLFIHGKTADHSVREAFSTFQQSIPINTAEITKIFSLGLSSALEYVR